MLSNEAKTFGTYGNGYKQDEISLHKKHKISIAMPKNTWNGHTIFGITTKIVCFVDVTTFSDK